MKRLTLEQYNDILDSQFNDPDDGELVEVREYLCEQLRALWRLGEGFSGKRPLGNSGWEDCLQVPLVRAGALPGTLTEDEDGYVSVVADGAAGLGDYETHVDNLILVLCGFHPEPAE